VSISFFGFEIQDGSRKLLLVRPIQEPFKRSDLYRLWTGWSERLLVFGGRKPHVNRQVKTPVLRQFLGGRQHLVADFR